MEVNWHWHIVEGVADLKYDTNWCHVNGGVIDKRLHLDGLSRDGTTEYLDDLKKEFPEQISIYRNGKVFWDGKVSMCNAFINKLPEMCILWQVDMDEFWTPECISKMYDLFLKFPQKMGAYFYCYYFVGPRKFVSTMNTWATHAKDWLRAFRFYRGFRWEKHEPPTLIDENGVNWTEDKSFHRDFTLNEGITFQHFAYALPSQLRFKEIYYGYRNALERWKMLQSEQGSIQISHFLPWARGIARADDWDEEKHGQLLFPGRWMK